MKQEVAHDTKPAAFLHFHPFSMSFSMSSREKGSAAAFKAIGLGGLGAGGVELEGKAVAPGSSDRRSGGLIFLRKGNSTDRAR